MNDDMSPATRADIKLLEHKLDKYKDEIMRHFDVVAENIRHDLLGAKSDEIELLKDTHHDHERRIRRLERSAGLIAA